MVNQKGTEDAVQRSKTIPHHSIGLHLNFTNGNPVVSPTNIPLQDDKNGKFVNSFVKLTLLTILHPRKMKYRIWREVNAQIIEKTSLYFNLYRRRPSYSDDVVFFIK